MSSEAQKVASRKHYLAKYGMTPEEYDAAVASGKCAVEGCGSQVKLRMDAKGHKLLCSACAHLVQVSKRDGYRLMQVARYLGVEVDVGNDMEFDPEDLSQEEREIRSAEIETAKEALGAAGYGGGDIDLDEFMRS